MTYRLLLLDDDRTVRNIVQKALSESGYIVDIANSADQALEAIRWNRPDMLITDVEHPGMNGFELTREIRLCSNLPIMFLTARSDVVSVVRGFESGADSYVTKPFDMPELLARVRSILRRSGAKTRKSA